MREGRGPCGGLVCGEGGPGIVCIRQKGASVGAETFDAYAVLQPYAAAHLPDGIHPDPEAAAALVRAYAEKIRGR